MLRNVLKVLTYTFISLVTTKTLLNTIDLGPSPFPELILLLMTLFMLNMFLQPILGILSLPEEGLKYLLIHFLFTVIFLLVLIQILDNLRIIELNTENLLFIGGMVPSSSLSNSLSLVVTSLVLSVIYRYLVWLTPKK
ncbi:hypothetical protein A3F07_01155 [candidate division WWE3 bacterium RIFCSPHIGHO2_12_FULL_38_15]|uniref:Uncharacterized protein n=1 Tax=candidate division WWE3 bacterium RIFCSPHIGHO2_02_FULL_38_14 TaxID=1802620 RepID=A0A1F4VA04_UNCKA|nr:MAG: hypothetical protein A2793_03645 [candidate division WWE3 bacterium RIFCSPHIGHO2_01_FULL_38_45]OGC49183.1 MAG: hypothetical protein A3F07_01155 [candidate division WWE3 bacterium RIFCSPHIGHO2_12_FULL_38_15]OGC52551.1 MAG: hypothetical protein A3B64_03250 [candidate division WWE3 bacterium RIFCSPLOWO2_01_FULL_37_24]OGC54042.1 MAG: hypothetical protein A3D91_04775 [candidate division WWE3 bacterium RIFCSPHIGHO2_02_FULL_38_14]HLB51443.1 hypothetical protein [Patescibacteria group bacterium